MNQLIKRCVMLTLIWTSTIFITWCTLFNKKENVEEQKNQEITMKNDNKIQSFDSLVLTTNEKISNWVSEFFQKNDKYLNEKKIKSEAKWNITISYWNVVWTINFDSMWKIDKELNKLFWKLAFWFEWKNLQEIDKNQKDMKVDIWIEWILWWKTSFVRITNWELWWIDMFLFPENWSKLLKKIKDKWIRFHWKTICDKWHKDYSEQWCMISKQLNNFKEEFIKFIVLFLICFNALEFDEIYDSIVYSTFLSLGFIFIENIIYINTLNINFIDVVLRSIMSCGVHFALGVTMGYFIGYAKDNQINYKYFSSVTNIFLAFLIPSILHGIYDLLISLSIKYNNISYFVPCYVMIVFIVSYFMFNKYLSLRNNNFVSFTN